MVYSYIAYITGGFLEDQGRGSFYFSLPTYGAARFQVLASAPWASALAVASARLESVEGLGAVVRKAGARVGGVQVEPHLLYQVLQRPFCVGIRLNPFLL